MLKIPSFLSATGIYFNRRILVVGLLGFACGVPFYLKSSTLVIWLAEYGISYTTIGLFSLVSVPATLKFLWGPLIDRMPIPYLTRWMGQRRSWLFVSQLTLITALSLFTQLNPHDHLFYMAVLSVLMSFAASTQDTVMLAYQVESLQESHYGPGEGMSVLGFRMGLLLSGGGALYLATAFGWSAAYGAMALCVSVGMITVFCIEEPLRKINPKERIRAQQIEGFLKRFPNLKGKRRGMVQWLYEAAVCPFAEFMSRKGWVYGLLLMIFYRLNDNLIGGMGNVFYLELGFSKIDIANATKFFGVWATICGGIIGGALVTRYGFLRSLIYFGLLHGMANLMYIVLACAGGHLPLLYVAIALENVTGGMRTTALFAYQMTLCNVSYTATQLALLQSAVNFGHTVFASFSGWLVVHLGWIPFFTLTILGTFPGVWIAWLANREKNAMLGSAQEDTTSLTVKEV